MKTRYNFKYYLGEGLRSIFVNGFMSFAAVSIIVACLLITGSVALMAVNIDLEINKLLENNQTAIFLDDTLTREQALAVKDELLKIENIAEATFVAKEDALQQYKNQLGEDAVVLEGLETDNPLRDGYMIRVSDVSIMNDTIETVRQLPAIKNVRDDQSTAGKLVKVRQAFETVALALVLALGCVSVFIISNTVKLAMFARREEIGIMKMVGATNWFIRWPFVIEGLVLGLVAGFICFFAQWGVYAQIQNTIVEIIGVIHIMEFRDIAPMVAIAFAVSSMVIGVIGSTLTIRKFLDV